MAMYSTCKTGYCNHFAAAYTSAHHHRIMDTAFAVSIVAVLENPVLHT